MFTRHEVAIIQSNIVHRRLGKALRLEMVLGCVENLVDSFGWGHDRRPGVNWCSKSEDVFILARKALEVKGGQSDLSIPSVLFPLATRAAIH